MSYEEIENKVKEWLLFTKTDSLKVLLATTIINHFEGDPLWLFLVGPSSSLKTELIRALNGVKKVYPLSDLTPQTLVSGFKKKNVSLLPKLSGHILALKDFTTVLSMHHDKRAEILAQLREIYDGYYKKVFGTGTVVEWKGKIGFIAGVTPILDKYYSIFQVLGERFIQFRLPPEDPIATARKAIDNIGQENNMRNEICQLVSGFVNSRISTGCDVVTSEEYKNKIANLATFCVRARSGVVRDGYSRELIYTPEPEAPPRFAKQIQLLGSGLAKVSDSESIGENEYSLMLKAGFDSIPKNRMKIIQSLLHSKDWLSQKELSALLKYPPTTTSRILQELYSLQIVEKGEGDNYFLSELSRQLLLEALPEESYR